MKAVDALKIIEPIPVENFCTDTYENGKGQRCFFGHIHHHLTRSAVGFSDEAWDFRVSSRKFLGEKHNIHADAAHVNNDPIYNGYTEPVIKDRVVHLLKDMVEAGY